MVTLETLYAIYLDHPQVFTDSRRVVKNGLFFALKGENFDGNRFAEAALENGAAYAVIDDPQLAGSHDGMLLVEDSLQALQDLARHHRRQLQIPVIGITGSNGKTTTKELVSAVLHQKYRLFYTAGNYNNHIGVPLTILSIPTHAEMAVIEMGANHQGEIAFLCTISQPSHGLITNIGKAHLEGFGGIEGVKKGKSELYRYLAQHDGIVFINLSEAFLEELAQDVERKVFYQQTPEASFYKKDNYGFELKEAAPLVRAAFRDEHGKEWYIHSQLPGAYNFNNIITAIALGLYFEVPAERIVSAIEAYTPQNNRSQILQSGSNTILLDAYNANPTSMIEALRNFDKMEGDRKIVVLGDMLELGDYAEEEHQQIAELARSMDFQDIILVGEEFAKLGEEEVYIFKNVEQLKAWWKGEGIENALILIKGSRRLQLERLLDDD
jgi:UDP-N-acetylmuramoyl-tripeptide--D-alanyl-D-alanine ligase